MRNVCKVTGFNFLRGWVFSGCILPGLALALLLVGCAHTPKDEINRAPASRPPSFLTGPIGLLLTNASSFSVQIAITGEPFGAAVDLSSGQLLGSGAKLLFAPDFGGSAKARTRAGGISFIWNSAEQRGFVVSERMQAYAPFSPPIQVTNLILSPDSSGPQKLEGHWCRPENITARMSDGTTNQFHVFRAADLHDLPIRIEWGGGSLALAKIRLQPLPAEIFAPPAGFTQHPSAEAMLDEMAVRQGRHRKRGIEDLSLPETSRSRYK